MYKIMILLNNSSETTCPVSTKIHVDPTVEMGLRVCSNCHTPLTVMPIYGKKNTKKLECAVDGVPSQIPRLIANSLTDGSTDGGT